MRWAGLGLPVWILFCASSTSCIKAKDPKQSKNVVKSTTSTEKDLPPDSSTFESSDAEIAATAERSSLEETFAKVMEEQCLSCHADSVARKGRLGDVRDLQDLESSGMIKWGEPEASPLYLRMASEASPMPPAGKVSDREVEVVRQFIAENGQQPSSFVAISDDQLLTSALDDLANLPEAEQRETRYFTFHHLRSEGRPARDTERMTKALGKILNSLSSQPEIALPTLIDPELLLYRVRLSDYFADSLEFDQFLEDFYPFASRTPGRDYDKLEELTLSNRPILRGDWFIATAPMPPNYHRLLNLPNTLQALETSLNLVVAGGVRRAKRSGFTGSGVSFYNRVIERIDRSFLGQFYYRSYDFGSSSEALRTNIMIFPLNEGAHAMAEDGGEMIFSLPNGMLGFYLADSAGQRLDKGPTNIVFDREGQFQGEILNGVSCMSCHHKGILPKDDMVRSFVEGNPENFDPVSRGEILELYAAKADLQQKIDEDNDRIASTLTSAANSPQADDPINWVYGYYISDLSRERVAAEMGASLEELADLIDADLSLGRELSALKVTGGTIRRDTFNQLFPQLKTLHYRTFLQNGDEGLQVLPPRLGDFLVDGSCLGNKPLSDCVRPAFGFRGGQER